MIRVVGVRFQQDGKIIQYNAMDLEPHMGDYVVTETGRGLDLGEVVLGVHEKSEDLVPEGLPSLIRIATPKDIQQATDNRSREQEAYRVCQQKILEHRLEMKLVSVESAFDRSKMMFYFTANGRVDFRALVKDLASTFKTRIELRQIGVRDEARMLGGLGCCGRPICCGSFLNDFQPVSIKMAKEQNLSLNPTKISGVCGRLMCCLKYEQDQYEQTRKRMPRIGKEVITPDGKGTVTELNIIKETVSVRIPSGESSEIKVYPLEQISRPGVNPGQIPVRQEENEAGMTDIGIEEDPEVTDIHLADEVQEEKDSTLEKTSKPARGIRAKKAHSEKSQNRMEQKAKREEIEDKPLGGEEKKEQRMNRPKGNGSRGKLNNKDRKFGQPVRRENPDREQKPSTNPQEEGSFPSVEPEEARKQVVAKSAIQGREPQKTEKTVRKNNWADALEKAIKAADQE